MYSTWLALLATTLAYGDHHAPAWLEYVPGLKAALYAIAVEEEWVVPGEYLADCAVDCVTRIRERRERLRNAPRLCILDRLPDVGWLEQQHRFAAAHLETLEARRAFVGASPADQHALEEWITEAQSLKTVYYEAWWAKQRSGQSHCRHALWERESLATIAAIIGRDQLETGVLPPCVPLWRFRRAD